MEKTRNNKSVQNRTEILTHDEIFIPNLNFRSLLINGYDETPHHHDFIEIFYIIKGKISHIANGIKKTLSVGDIVFLSPRTTHYFVRNEPCTYRNLCVTMEEFYEICHFINIPESHFINSPVIYSKMDFSDMEFIEKQIRRLSKSLTNLERINSLVRSFLAFTFTLFLSDNNQTTTNDNLPPWLGQMLTLFYQKDIITYGLTEIKKHVFFSDSYLHRTFKKYMGKTMLEYLNDIRINYATILLQSLNSSILEISNEIGFSSVGYFNKLFKKKYGITPAQYRKKNRAKNTKPAKS